MTLTAPRAALVAGVSLGVVYVATLAPGVTFWDAGEFIAAAHSLGIPHPPGTPLFVVALNAWAKLWGFLPFATATNLFSAAATATAGGLTALWIARATRQPLAGLAAGLAAGAMSTVWQNATETEVYAASLFVAVAGLVTADRAGRSGNPRYTMLAAYLLALAVPIHLSILVVGPAVVLLAADRPAGFDLRTALVLTGVSVGVAGVGRMSLALVAVGVALVLASAFVASGDGSVESNRLLPAGALVVAAVAISAVAFLLIRSRLDPAINQGNPRSWSQLAYVVARRQYDVAGLWPRRAPVWLQLANWFEYADWQWALSLAPGVVPTVGRVLVTLLFGALGIVGAAWHKRIDPRTWRVALLLFLCGSVGVTAYLNLRAGRSFAWGFVPTNAGHEARDRDYFFMLGFWAWGIWAGMGAVFLASRLRRPWLGVVAAALPVALNWTVVNRRAEPDASLARETAHQLLDQLPPRTVLFVDGDNDTYPLWYAQQVDAERRDVTIVTLPLLGAPWYAEELRRRSGLGDGRASDPAIAAGRAAADARRLNRPIAAANTLDASERQGLSSRWHVIGLVSIADGPPVRDSQSAEIVLDRSALRSVAQSIESWRRGRTVREATDPIHEYFMDLFSCPGRLADSARATPSGSLDSLCNLR